MDILMKIACFMCVFSWTQAEKIFVDYNGYVVKVPKQRIKPLDENIWAQAVMYSSLALIVVFIMWLSIHDTQKTLLIKYYMDEESLKTRQVLPEDQSSRSFADIKYRSSSSRTAASAPSPRQEVTKQESGSHTKGGGKPSLLLCTSPWLKGKKRISAASSRPQLVPQLSNWLITPQLSAHVIGVEGPGYHAAMPVEFHLPGHVPNKNTESAEKKVLKSDALYGELTVPNVQVTKELGQKLSGLSLIEVGPSCVTELDPCYKGLLMPNMDSANVPSGGASAYRCKPSLVLGADRTDQRQPHDHGVYGLSRVSRIMEEVCGGTLRQPVPMVLSSVALSFIAYKLITKYGSS